MYKWIIYILLCSLFFLSAGCNKEDWKPYLKGSMVGYVVLFDEFGNKLDNNGNVKVTAIGLDRNYSGYSDAAGRFEISGVPTGTYEIHLEKEGFGTFKQYGVQHLGGQPTILSCEGCIFYLLCKMSTASIQDLRYEHDSVWADIHYTTQAPEYIYMVFYFSDSVSFTSANANFVTTTSLAKSGTLYTGKISSAYLPFTATSKVYYRAAVFTFVTGTEIESHFFPGTGTYYDFDKQCHIYPNASQESNQYEFLMP